jgi:hypothetical protein
MNKEKNKPKETKQEKFNRILENRLTGFVIATDRLAKMSNKTYFDYTDSDKERIFNIIDNEVKFLKDQFLRYNK